MQTRNRRIIAVAVFFLAAALLFTVYCFFAPRGEVGDKTITVVISYDDTQKTESINTSSANLRGALDEAELIEGEDGSYGFYVTAVDGRTADEAAREWWSFSKDGELLNTGVDDTPISDGDTFEITLDTW